jgi:hypothetical protein
MGLEKIKEEDQKLQNCFLIYTFPIPYFSDEQEQKISSSVILCSLIVTLLISHAVLSFYVNQNIR